MNTNAPEARPIRVVADRCAPPTVALIGVGGCGINLSRQILASSIIVEGRSQSLASLVDFSNYVDTSRANIRSGERLSIISEGHGSGKVRNTNASEIRRNIPMLTEDVIGDTDVVIVVFGCSGGTGSVMGPLLIQDLKRRGKTVVFVGSAETTSQIDCQNTLGCLKTVNLLTERDDLYLPTILTETTTNRREADRYLVGQTVGLVEILKRDVIEIDRNDRLNWLNAGKTMSVESGMHPLYILSNLHTEAENVADFNNPSLAADSALYIGVDHADGSRSLEVSPVKMERFRKDGAFIFEGEADTDPMVGIVMSTSKVLESIIERIEAKKTMFAQQRPEASKIVKASLAATENDDDIFL